MNTAPSSRPQLTCTPCTETGVEVAWNIDARRLRSKEKTLVSPTFELPMGAAVQFRLMVYAKRRSQKKGGDNFGKARGSGSIHLKCEANHLEEHPRQSLLAFRIAVGSEPWRGPVTHDFALESVAGLPAIQQYWNPRTAASSQIFTIRLRVECQ